MEDRIARARQLLAEIHHIPVATVNEDGTPHNSPVFMAFDEHLNGYWASHPDNQHSRNIMRDDRVFLVVFDSREGHGGLFISAIAEPLEDRERVQHGHQVLKELKERFYGTMGDVEAYMNDGQQRIYCAKPIHAWVNKSDRDGNGVIIRDNRYEIKLADLM
jgi:general stress protein 26